ncbi:MAG TPA: FkbM family methyltransferase [Mucilaginibacter sp.]|jgi:FkbM family methyltransferase
MLKGLLKLKNLDIAVNAIIDVGAAAGSWTVMAKGIWPECSYILFEPLEERQPELTKLAHDHPGIFIVPFAAGNAVSETSFYIADDLDGSGVANSKGESQNTRTVKQTSIDIEIKKLNLKGPYIIKLDTHGYEVPIIEGCANVINDVSAFIIECYGFQITDRSLLFDQMCRYMDGLGFHLFDIVDIMHRPADGAFWQCDAFFIRKDNPVYESAKYN